MVVVSVTGGCGAKGEVIDGFDAGANARYLHSCQWQTGRGQDKDKCVCVCVCVCGDSRGLRGNVVYLNRLVEAELLLLGNGVHHHLCDIDKRG